MVIKGSRQSLHLPLLLQKRKRCKKKAGDAEIEADAAAEAAYVSRATAPFTW